MVKNDYYASLLRNWKYPLAQRLQGRDFHRTMNAAVKNQSQFVQKKSDLFELNVVSKDGSFGPAEQEFIRDAVRKNLDGSKSNINVVGTLRPIRYAAECDQGCEAARQAGIVLV